MSRRKKVEEPIVAESTPKKKYNKYHNIKTEVDRYTI